MMPLPRPLPPYLPAYPESERAKIQARYEELEREWQRDASITMGLNTALAVTPFLGLAIVIVGCAFVVLR